MFPVFQCLRAEAGLRTVVSQVCGRWIATSFGRRLPWTDDPTEHREQERHDAARKLPCIGGGIGW